MSTPSAEETIPPILDETEPFLSVEFDYAGIPAKARTNGVAISTPLGGAATVVRYGVAYALSGGRASGGPAGVAVTHNGGLSNSGDGGASIAYYGNAACGAHGVAFCITPGPIGLGKVSGGTGATLVISWVNAQSSFSKSVRVGDTVDGIEIMPGIWYSLNPENNYAWIRVNAPLLAEPE